MTVPSSYAPGEFVADGAGTPRTIGFKLRNAGDLRIEVDGVPQILGAHYSIVGSWPNQSIVPIAPFWPSGAIVRYRRSTPRGQEYRIPSGQDLRAAALEDELDRTAMALLEQDEVLASLDRRTPQVPEGETAPEFASIEGLADGDLLEFRNGRIQRLNRAPFAGKFFAGDASGAPVPASGTGGGDMALRGDMALGTGASLLGWIRNAAGAVHRSLADLFDDRVSVMDFIPLLDRVAIRLAISTADVRGYIQAAIDHVAARGGGDLFVPNGVYRVVLNETVPDLGLIVKDRVALVGPGTLNLECSGTCYGVRLKNNARIGGGMTIAVTVSTSAPGQGIWHSCISIGDAYGFGGVPAAPSSFHFAHGWEIDGVTLTNVRPGGIAICGYGGISRGKVRNYKIPDSSTLYGCVHFDWGFVGPEGSIDSQDLPASRLNFDNGIAYTTHPSDIDVADGDIGDMSRAGSIPLRLSGIDHIRIRRATIAGCQEAGVYHHAGDMGYELALPAAKMLRHRGVEVHDVTVLKPRNGWGLWWDCKADNLADAIAEGYVPYLAAIGRMGARISNFRTFGDGSAGVVAGARIQQVIGVELLNVLATGHQQGVLLEEGAEDIFVDGELFDNREDGALAAHPTLPPQRVSFVGVRAYLNNSSGAEGPANIRLSNVDYADVLNCVLGAPGEQAEFGLRADGTVTGLAVEGNHVVAGPVGYSIGANGEYTILRSYHANTTGPGVTTPYAGVEIVTEEVKAGSDGVARRHARALRSALVDDTTPAGGAWLEGETIEFETKAANGREGSVCTASGSPGTWKQTGSVAA